MRTDLEAAMAAVIASSQASARFLEAPDLFGLEHALTTQELAMLTEMADDLASLTPSFVHKRRSTLRWNVRRTLELLEGEGEQLLDDFVEDNPQTASFRDDAAALGNFFVARTAGRPRAGAVDSIIAEMARYERCRSQAFWHATDDRRPTQGPSEDVISLAPGAVVGRFDRDMRLPYRRSVDPWSLLPEDRCDLLFFFARQRSQLRTIRLRPGDAALVTSLTAGEPTPLRSLVAGAPVGVDVEQLLRRLAWEEAVQWG